MSGDESFLPLENRQVSNLSTLYFLLSTLYWPSANGGVAKVESVLAVIQAIDQSAKHA